MAIGDGFNDNLMFEAADASIGIVDKFNHTNKANLLISGFGIIPSLFANSGRWVKKLQDSSQFMYSSFIIFFFSNFFFSWYNNFNGSGLYKNGIVFFVYYVHSAVFAIFLFYSPFSRKEGFSNSRIIKYQEGNSQKSRIIIKFLMFGTVTPLIQVIWAFYFAFYVVNYYFDSNGFDTGLDTIQAMLLVCFLAINTINVNHLKKKKFCSNF